jgi:hypothetical protein
MEHNVAVEAKIGSSVSLDAKVQRGQESWTYIYITLGFAISIEGTVIAMTPLTFPWNVILYVIVAFLTGWAWIDSGWLHNKLIGLKGRYETKPR